MTTNTEMMTEREAAERMRMSVRTLQSWRVSGGGPVYAKLGRAVRYDRGQIDIWLTTRATVSTSAHSAAAPAVGAN